LSGYIGLLDGPLDRKVCRKVLPRHSVVFRVTGFAYKPPQSEELDKAAPQRKGESNLWQCPFCGQADFPELTEVSKRIILLRTYISVCMVTFSSFQSSVK
jgi:hypothetical protein